VFDKFLLAVSTHLDRHGGVPCCPSDHGDRPVTPATAPVDPKQQAVADWNNSIAALAMGASVGIAGTVSALLIRATCPICVVLA
jgi:hypothetical protein